jgi:hypothetical protein
MDGGHSERRGTAGVINAMRLGRAADGRVRNASGNPMPNHNAGVLQSLDCQMVLCKNSRSPSQRWNALMHTNNPKSWLPRYVLCFSCTLLISSRWFSGLVPIWTARSTKDVFNLR